MSDELPWLAAFQSDTNDLITLRSCDPNMKDTLGYSALDLLILAALFNLDKSIKVNYKTIVHFFNAGFDVDSACIHGCITPLCLAQFGRLQVNDFKISHYFTRYLKRTRFQTKKADFMRDISFILMDDGATLKANQYNLSPLSYTQLYFHISPHQQNTLLYRYPRNIDVKELYQLALLKVVTPENNYAAFLKTIVKHGIPFNHQLISVELNLESIMPVLFEILRLFGTETFSYIYNLPSYHCGYSIEQISSFRGNELEIIGAVCHFVNFHYSSRDLSSHYSRIFDPKPKKNRMFLVLTIFIALWEIFVSKDEGSTSLMKTLSKTLKSETALHHIIATKDKWLGAQIMNSRTSEYFGKILLHINEGLWHRVTYLMVNQVNNRVGDRGLTPLHIATLALDLEMVVYLLEKLGAYPYTLSYEGKLFYECPLLNNWRRNAVLCRIRKWYIAQVPPLKTISAIAICKYRIKYSSLPILYTFIGLHSQKPAIKF